jgi:Ca-activated chloride channel homolog
MIGWWMRNAALAALLLPGSLVLGFQLNEVVPQAQLRVDASLVLVPVQATRGDIPALDLQAEQFRISENGVDQSLRYFGQDDAPISVGLLWDSSASMRTKERKAAQAAAAFFRTASAADEFFLIRFDENARLATPFTSDTDRVYSELLHSRPFGRTALFDAVQLGLEAMKQARHPRKALLILSDGDDNRSRRSFAAIRNSALESDVQIYAMEVSGGSPEGSAPAAESSGSRLLSQLAELTGGRHFQVDFADLDATAERVGRLMRNEYLLGYSPSDAKRDGTYRKITVQVEPSAGPVSLTYRRGYIAPAH